MNEEEIEIDEWEHFPSFYREQILAILKRRFPESRATRFEARMALFIPDELKKGTYSLRAIDAETGEIVWHGIEARVQPLAHDRAKLILKWDDNWPEVAELAAEIREGFEKRGDRDEFADLLAEIRAAPEATRPQVNKEELKPLTRKDAIVRAAKAHELLTQEKAPRSLKAACKEARTDRHTYWRWYYNHRGEVK